MEKEEAEHANIDSPCEPAVLLEMVGDTDTKNDPEPELSDLYKVTDDEDVLLIPGVESYDNIFAESIDLKEVVAEESKEVALDESEGNTNAERTTGEKPEATASLKNEVQLNNSTETGWQEVEFVSDDIKEDLDNFDEKWNYLKSLSEKGDTNSFIRKRWGNSKIPDPSIDLTYRHRSSGSRKSERDIKRIKKRRKKSRSQSLSCISHIEKLINDVKISYCSKLRKLCEQHSLITREIQRHYQMRFISLIQHSVNNMDFNPKTAQELLLKQRQEEMLQADKYQRRLLDLVNKTNSSLERYKKDSEEILAFHKQYKIGVGGLLTSEQGTNLRDTERMYTVYEKFYR